MQTPESLLHNNAATSPHNPNKRFLDETISVREILFITALIACITPWISPAIALILGIAATQRLGHPFMQHNHTITQYLLQFSVVGLGFGMNATAALNTGLQSTGFIAIAISITVAAGIAIGKFLGIESKTAFLIAGGTAICGGSAIAALTPAIQARTNQAAAALGVIFTLNALALFIFPPIGHALHLSQQQFGTWAALAIHDTSAVLGAASKYGPAALQTATTLKLARTLFIIPLTLIAAITRKSGLRAIRIPWFIILFIAAMLLHTFLPIDTITPYILHLSKTALTLTLFFIGASLSRQAIANIGWKPLIQGAIVWALVAAITLYMITGASL